MADHRNSDSTGEEDIMADHRNSDSTAEEDIMAGDSTGEEDISSELQEIKIEYNPEKIMDLESFRKKKKLPTIYRVPDVLHEMNERAYTPSIVAIGPLHRGKKHLQAMEKEKRTYTNFLFYRTGNVQQTRDLCYSAMLKMVSDARRCYADDVRLDAEMMLVDGCFMIELFYRCKLDVFDPILKNTFKRPAILKDLILLENQIPFEVLDKLFQLTVERILAENTPSLTECVLSLYWDVTSPKQRRFGKKDHKTTAHVLHLLHSCHLQLEEAALPPKEAEVPSHHFPREEADLPPKEVEEPSHHLPQEEAEVPPEQMHYLPREGGDLPPELRLKQSYHMAQEETEVPSYYLPPEEADLPPEEAEYPSHHLPPEEAKVPTKPSYNLPRVVGSYYLPQGKEAEDPSDHLPQLVGSYYLPQGKEEAENPRLYNLLPELEPTGSYYMPQGKEAEDPSHRLRGSCQLPPEQSSDKEEAEMVLRNFKFSATELDLGGIKFEKLNKKDIFCVEFLTHFGFWRRGHFKIPPFLVDDLTELFWRNFIAFEQSCHFITKSYFTSHALLMDRLINTTKDVQLLEEKGIIVNTMGSPEEVANLFNNLCNNIAAKEFNSTEACKDVINFHKRLWPKFLVKLRRDYFSNPWAAISVLAAVGLFVLTLLQTIYTMRS